MNDTQSCRLILIQITARRLYQSEFEFEFEFIPHFKLFINTNYLPQIQDETLFTSGRIVVVLRRENLLVGCRSLTL